MRYSIDALREEKQDLLIEEANRAGLKQRLDELEAFLEEQTTEVTEYDEGLVRQLNESFSGKSDVKNLTFCINRSRILIENLALCQKCQETESLKFFYWR